jgi:hypothetical protein
MQRNQVTEKLWNMSTQQFSYTPHLFGGYNASEKNLHTQDFITSIYYYYLIDTYDGIKRFLIKHPLHKPGLWIQRSSCIIPNKFLNSSISLKIFKNHHRLTPKRCSPFQSSPLT